MPRGVYVRTEEHKKIISKSLMGHTRNLGRKASDETKQKMRDRMSDDRNPFFGRTHSAESILKMSETRKGNQYALGHKLADDVKRKISQRTKEGLSHPEVRKRLSESAKKRPPISEETRKKLSEITVKRIQNGRYLLNTFK